MNSEKDRRWDLLLAAHSSNERVAQEAGYIRRNETPLIDILCNLHETSFRKEDFLSLFSTLSLLIPDEWFLQPPLSDDSFLCFDALPVVACLTAKARHKIWIDVPRTFMAFMTGDNPHVSYVKLLSNPEQTAHLMAVLCRTLCASATFLKGRYCQGMSFLAASYILYCRVFLYENVDSSVEDEEKEAYAAAAYHFIALQHHELADLYVKENSLTEYIKEFEWHLSSPYAPEHRGPTHCNIAKNIEIRNKLRELYDHLQFHGLEAQFFVVQWFGSCFALNVSAEMLCCLQEIFIYGSASQCTRSLMLRLGVAILYVLADDLLVLHTFEDLYMCLKTKVLKVTPVNVIPILFMFEMTPPPPSATDKDKICAKKICNGGVHNTTDVSGGDNAGGDNPGMM